MCRYLGLSSSLVIWNFQHSHFFPKRWPCECWIFGCCVVLNIFWQQLWWISDESSPVPLVIKPIQSLGKIIQTQSGQAEDHVCHHPGCPQPRCSRTYAARDKHPEEMIESICSGICRCATFTYIYIHTIYNIFPLQRSPKTKKHDDSKRYTPSKRVFVFIWEGLVAHGLRSPTKRLNKPN